MGFNGSGNVIRSDGFLTGSNICETQRSTGVGANAERFDNDFNNLAAAIEQCVTLNGETGALTQDLDLGTNKIVNIGSPSSLTDVVNNQALLTQSINFSNTTGGSGGAFTLSLTPSPTSYTLGMIVRCALNHEHAGAATLNVNGLGAKNILVGNATPTGFQLAGNDLCTFVYDGVNFQLISRVRSNLAWTPTVGVTGGTSGTLSNLQLHQQNYRKSDLISGVELYLSFRIDTNAGFDRSITITPPITSTTAASNRNHLSASFSRTGTGSPSASVIRAFFNGSNEIVLDLSNLSDTTFPESSTMYITVQGTYEL